MCKYGKDDKYHINHTMRIQSASVCVCAIYATENDTNHYVFAVLRAHTNAQINCTAMYYISHNTNDTHTHCTAFAVGRIVAQSTAYSIANINSGRFDDEVVACENAMNPI